MAEGEGKIRTNEKRRVDQGEGRKVYGEMGRRDIRRWLERDEEEGGKGRNV